MADNSGQNWAVEQLMTAEKKANQIIEEAQKQR